MKAATWSVVRRSRICPAPAFGGATIEDDQLGVLTKKRALLAAQRPVVAFTLKPTLRGHVPSMQSWDSFGLHAYVLQPKAHSTPNSPTNMTRKLSRSASQFFNATIFENDISTDDDDDEDDMATRRAFTVVRLPATITSRILAPTDSDIAAWRSSLESPAAQHFAPEQLQLWVRRFQAPMAATARFLHDKAGSKQYPSVRMAGPAGTPLDIRGALRGVTAASPGVPESALLVAVCGGTGVTPFLDVVYALVAGSSREGARHVEALPCRVHLHVMMTVPDVGSAVGVAFLALAAAVSAGRRGGHTVSLHVHVTRGSASLGVGDLGLPGSLVDMLRVARRGGGDASSGGVGGVEWVRVSSGSLRSPRAMSNALLESLTQASLCCQRACTQPPPQEAILSVPAQAVMHCQRFTRLWVCGPPQLAPAVVVGLQGSPQKHTRSRSITDETTLDGHEAAFARWLAWYGWYRGVELPVDFVLREAASMRKRIRALHS